MSWIKSLGRWWSAPQTKPVGPEHLLTDAERNILQDKLFEFSYWISESVTGKPNWYMSGTPQELFNYPNKTLMAIYDYTLIDDVNLVSTRACEHFLSLITQPDLTISGYTINEYLAFLPVTGALPRPYDVFQMLMGLHAYSHLPMMNDYSEADDQTKQSISALITATGILHKAKSDADVQAYDYIYRGSASVGQNHPLEDSRFIPLSTTGVINIACDDLISLIIENPEHAEAIATVILEDKISDATLVRDRVFSSAQSLRSGML